MTYALVIDDAIQQVGRLPGSARILATGQWFCPPGGLVNATEAQQRACGWFEVNDTPPAYDDATEVLVRGEVVLISGVVIREYTIRDKTTEELAADAFNTAVNQNTETLTDVTTIEAQLDALKGFLVDPDVQASLDRANAQMPTAQELNRTLKAIIRQLRRQANMTIRLSRVACGVENPELLVDVSDVGEA